MARGIRQKNIARIEQTRPGRGTTRGWYVQVIWGGHRYTKWFADSKFGGTRKALVAAAAWRDEIEKKIGRPPSDEPVFSDRAEGQKDAKAGAWLWKGQKDGRPAYWITWRRPDGKLSHTTVSIARYGKAEALEIANERYKEIVKALKKGREPYGASRAKSATKRPDAAQKRTAATAAAKKKARLVVKSTRKRVTKAVAKAKPAVKRRRPVT